MFHLVALAALGVVLLTGCTLGGSSDPDASATTQPTQSSSVRYADYCEGEPNCASGSVPAELRRPLDLPELTAGEGCPTSSLKQLTSAFGPGLGDGPVYPIGFTAEGAFPIQLPPFSAGHQFAGSEWGGEKMLWVADPDYEGPILIRGRQLDGANAVRFDREPSTLLPELQFPPRYASNYEGGWRNFPSHARLRAPGCYAFLVDGADFSTAVVFEAVPE